MRRRLAAITGTLLAGVVAGGGLYWVFLSTPDSNAMMLGVSALSFVAACLVLGVAVNAALLLGYGATVREGLRAGSRGLGWFVLAALLLAGTWWIVLAAEAWIAAHHGEISAWLIAQWDWSDSSALVTAAAWIGRWLRWAVLPLTALSLLASLLTRERAGLRWLRRAWSPTALLVAAAVFALLMVLPWQLTAWRPEVPDTWLQPATAALRLGSVGLLGTIGAALLVLTATRPTRPTSPTRPI